jgi:hypothetical protein
LEIYGIINASGGTMAGWEIKENEIISGEFGKSGSIYLSTVGRSNR